MTRECAQNVRTAQDGARRIFPTATAERRSLDEASLAVECTYTDPLIDLRGWDALEAYTTDFHSQVPGGHFVTRWFQTHHGRAVAAWDMVAGDGTRNGEGVSHVRIGDDGKLAELTGFFDTPATPATLAI